MANVNDPSKGFQDAAPRWRAVMHVLVVEYDRDTRDLLKQALNDAGYEVSQAKGHTDALRLSRLHPDIDVTIVDTHACPSRSGIDVTREIRRRLNNSHYIVTSCDWETLKSSRFDDVSVLRKPYGKKELLRAVHCGVARCVERRLFDAKID
jgi:DNA-binding response OmpR family regulator